MDVLKSVSPHQLCLSTLEGVYQGEGPKYNLQISVEVQDQGTWEETEPLKRLYFLLKSKETELYGNTSEVYTENTTISCTKLKLLIFNDSDFPQ